VKCRYAVAPQFASVVSLRTGSGTASLAGVLPSDVSAARTVKGEAELLAPPKPCAGCAGVGNASTSAARSPSAGNANAITT
jgi:hypothetical protein